MELSSSLYCIVFVILFCVGRMGCICIVGCIVLSWLYCIIFACIVLSWLYWIEWGMWYRVECNVCN